MYGDGILYRISPSNHNLSFQCSKTQCAFGRIIIRLDSTKKNILVTLKDTIKHINAEALGLDKYPIQVQEAAMSTQKLNQ